MHKLAVQDTGALRVRGQQPDDKSNLQLEIKRKPDKTSNTYITNFNMIHLRDISAD